MTNHYRKMTKIVNALNSLNDVFKDALAESGIKIDWYYKDLNQAQDSECEYLEIFFRDFNRKTMDIFFERFSMVFLNDQETIDFYMAMRVIEQRPLSLGAYKSITRRNLIKSCKIIVEMLIDEHKEYRSNNYLVETPPRYSNEKILKEIERTCNSCLVYGINSGDK